MASEAATDTQSEPWHIRRIKRIVVVLAIVAALLAILATSFYVAVFWGPLSTRQEIWGQFGDYVGGTLNPVLAFFAFIALLFTIVFQSHELKVTNDELRKSVDAAKHQTFEATFFQLVRLYNSNVAAISTKEMDRGIDLYYSGRDALFLLAEELLGAMKQAAKEAPTKGRTEDPVYNFSEGFKLLQREKKVNLQHLFYTLHEIFWFLDTEPLEMDNRYARIMRSQLSTAELMMLACFCVSDGPCSLSMKSFVEYYSLLELMTDGAKDKVRKLQVFRESAFGV